MKYALSLFQFLVLAGWAHVAAASVSEPGAEVSALWNDPTFQKQFLASYGSASDIEPKEVSTEERDALRKILPLLSTNMAAAGVQLEKLIRPDSSAVLDFTLANIHFQQELFDKAAAGYRMAIQKFPAFRRAHKNLGLIHVREGNPAEAVRCFTRVIELGGGDSVTYGLLGHAYAAKEDFVSAESAFRSAALLQPDSVDWKMGLARCILKQQKYGEAAALFSELIETNPERVDFWLLQANAFIGLKEPLKAAENYELLARMGKATLDSLNTLGDIYVNENSPDLAVRAYLAALDLDPTQPSARPLRAAEILASRSAAAQAKQILARIKEVQGDKLDDTARRRMLKLEARIAVAEGAGGEAAQVLEQIVSLDPLDGEALMLLGQHYGKAGQIEKAVFYYERAESIEAFEADAKVRHAQLLVSQSKLQDAVPLLRRANELKPRDSVARYLEQVERIAKAKR
jgi:tetratricopeptide (TPR) repeat protein